MAEGNAANKISIAGKAPGANDSGFATKRLLDYQGGSLATREGSPSKNRL